MTALWFPGDEILIGGAWLRLDDTLPVIDPSTGAGIGAIARGGADQIDAAVAAARAALGGDWGHLTAAERGRLMLALSALIGDRAEVLARIEAADVGKPLTQARADALAMARYFEFYGGAADKVMGDTIPYQTGYSVWTLREPHGVTAHIIPWNYPAQMFPRSVAPALAVGNCLVCALGW